MAEEGKLTPSTLTRIDRAVKATEIQVLEARQLLIQMGVGDGHPDYHSILASVMQTLAINFSAVVAQANS